MYFGQHEVFMLTARLLQAARGGPSAFEGVLPIANLMNDLCPSRELVLMQPFLSTLKRFVLTNPWRKR